MPGRTTNHRKDLINRSKVLTTTGSIIELEHNSQSPIQKKLHYELKEDKSIYTKITDKKK